MKQMTETYCYLVGKWITIVIYRNPFWLTNMFQTNSQAKSINKQTNKTPRMYISNAGCCLDDGWD